MCRTGKLNSFFVTGILTQNNKTGKQVELEPDFSPLTPASLVESVSGFDSSSWVSVINHRSVFSDLTY